MSRRLMLGIVIALMVSGISVATWRVLTRDGEKAPEAKVAAEREWVFSYDDTSSGLIYWASSGYSLYTWVFDDETGNPLFIVKNPPPEILNGCRKCVYKIYCNSDLSSIWIKVTYSSENFSIEDERLKILWLMKINNVMKVKILPCSEHEKQEE